MFETMLFQNCLGLTGAHLRNLLKLFDWVVEDVGSNINTTLPQPKEFEVAVIY